MMQSNRNGSRLYVMLCGTVVVLSLIALMGMIALAIVRNMTPDLPDDGSGGTSTKQVWVPSDNTLLLDLNITAKKIVYPDTGEQLTIADATAKAKPAYMVLTIGLNGVTSFVGNKNLYQNCYGKLIEAIQEASPDTKIILRSVFPVAANQKTFSVDAATLNGYIDTLNGYVLELAGKYEVRYLDTASVLKGADGNLPEAYQNGDGIHLTAEGYNVILNYIRTHGYQ